MTLPRPYHIQHHPALDSVRILTVGASRAAVASRSACIANPTAPAMLETAELAARYRATSDAATARRWQLIWLISRGATRDEAAGTVGVSSRWASALIARDNAEGAAGLVDGRCGNPGHAPLLDAAQVAALAVALAAPPEDGGLWTGRKVAAWLATHAGVATNPQRGVVYRRRLDRTLQVPRPRHVHAATAEEQAAFRKA